MDNVHRRTGVATLPAQENQNTNRLLKDSHLLRFPHPSAGSGQAPAVHGEPVEPRGPCIWPFLSSLPKRLFQQPANEAGPAGLPTIFGLFFQIGFLSFGGGLSAWLYREIVERRRWLTPADFLSGLALCQVMPGINVANLSIYIGQRLRGVPGAAIALIGLICAPFFIIIGLASVYAQIDSIPWVHNFLCGVATAAVGLVLSMALKSIRHAVRGIGPFAVLAVIILTVGVLRWSMVLVVLCVAPVSVTLAWRMKGAGRAR